MKSSYSYSFSFPAFIKGEFLTKLASLNKKLAKMADSNQVDIIHETLETRKVLKPEAHQKLKENRYFQPTPEDHMDIIFSVVEVSLPIQTKINGFDFVGTINIEGDVKTIYAVDNTINLTNVDPCICHHCHVRRQRNCVHIFAESQTGNLVSIGSTCTHDYIGLNIDSILYAFFNFYKTDDLYESRGMSGAWGFHAQHLIDAIRVSYAQNPSYLKASDDHKGTKGCVDCIYNILFHSLSSAALIEERNKLKEILLTAPVVGDLLVKTYGNLDPKTSNFNSNLVETLFYTNSNGEKIQRDFIVGKARGLFIWAVFNALNKAKEALEVKVQPFQELPSFHVGQIGSKLEVEGVIRFIKDMQTNFGFSRLIVVKGYNGAEVKTFGSGSSLWNVHVGDKVKLSGTISNHDEYKGNKVTMIKRAKIS
jgi:hypothetical protein